MGLSVQQVDSTMQRMPASSGFPSLRPCNATILAEIKMFPEQKVVCPAVFLLFSRVNSNSTSTMWHEKGVMPLQHGSHYQQRVAESLNKTTHVFYTGIFVQYAEFPKLICLGTISTRTSVTISGKQIFDLTLCKVILQSMQNTSIQINS